MVRTQLARSRMVAVVACGFLALTTACGSGTAARDKSDAIAEATKVKIDKNFDLDKLIKAAEAEGKKLTVYDSTGAVEDMAAAFQKKYGIETEGIKSDATETVEKMIREAKARNVTIDAAVISDIPSIVNELYPQDVAKNWIPPDLAENIPQKNPLVAVMSPSVWVYNNETYPDGCPVDNIWQLTKDDWKGKVAMGDPLNDPDIVDWFNEMSSQGVNDLEGAYANEFGKAFESEERDAAWEWVKRIAENDPKVFADQESMAAAVGVRGQDDPPIGLMSPAKFRDLEDKNYAMEVCEMSPWPGYAYPKAIVMATNTDVPNSAKLWIHYVMSEEGIQPQVTDGKISGNSSVPPAKDDPANMGEFVEDLLVFRTDSAVDNWNARPEMQDFWRLNYSS